MKLQIDFNPNSQKQDFIFNNREVILLNRKYKCKTFLSQEEADNYLDQHPSMEILSIDSEGINVIPSDYYGVEVVFTPYEFKRFESEINVVDFKLLSKQRKTWKK